jgi:hypothetical protein
LDEAIYADPVETFCDSCHSDKICSITGAPCTAKPVYIYDEADYAAIQAALAGAEETLLEIMADDVFAEMIKGAPLPRKTSKRKISEDCSNALARLRAVKDNGKG